MADVAALWRMVVEERLALADQLGGLTDDQWATPSLCAGWTVRDVVAHLAGHLGRPKARLFVRLAVTYRFDFDRFAYEGARAEPGSGPELLDRLRQHAGDRFAPPGMGPAAPLTDLVAHGQDVRRPLGIPHRLAPDRALPVLEFLTGRRATRGFVRADRRAGVTWRCTDMEWSWGSGPLVQGPAEAVIMALLGRAAVYGELGGDGVALMASR